MRNGPVTVAPLCPKEERLFDLTGFSGVTRQQLGSGFGNLSEVVLKSFDNTSMKSASRFAQKSAVSSVLN